MHKTGTTSFQSQCDEAIDELRSRGVLYPRSGRDQVHPGHALFSIEIYGSKRPLSRCGAVVGVLDEIRAAGCDRVLISSEGLSLAWKQPERLTMLREAFEGLGYEVHVLIGRREQESFMTAFYGTLVVSGTIVPRERFEEEARSTGQFEVARRSDKPASTVCMDPDRLVRAFTEVFSQERVHVVEYLPEGMIGRIVNSQAWFSGEEASLFTDELRENVTTGDFRRRALEDQLVSLRGSPVWRATNWMRSPRAHRIRAWFARCVGRPGRTG
jgi:hypothetical protein